MAKRKRKMTLFDVINTGQPIGMQVRQRVPTYQPTPELPVQKKLAKLFGRSKKERDPNQPMTAAEELELLRRELGGGKSSEPADEPREVHREPEAVEENDPTARFFASEERSRSEPSSPSRRAAEIARALDEEPEAQEPAEPKTPRKPLKQIVAERWEVISPKVDVAKQKALQWTTLAVQSAKTHAGSLRELNGRHAATAATVLGGIILLGGAFYVGKVLLQRPTTDLTLVDADGINTNPRPDVLDVSAQANQPIANVTSRDPDVSLERGTAQSIAPAASTVFGGRNLELNYVIIQSYYTQAEADAAIDVLKQYGIEATVERNLPNWSTPGRDLYSVVSTAGFAKMRDNEVYQSFLSTVAKVSDRETGSTLPKRLDPRPFKYRPS